MFLLDTNAVSEPGRLRPDPTFLAWFDSTPEPLQFLSALTVGEMRRGTDAMAPGRQRSQLEAVQTLLVTKHAARIFPVDLEVSLRWASLSLANRLVGRNVGVIDELVAATALVHDMTVVTRNTRHFEHSGCKILSPWSAP